MASKTTTVSKKKTKSTKKAPKTKVVNYGKRQADALQVMTEAGWK